MSTPVQTGWKHNVYSTYIRPSVRAHALPNCEHDILKTNELINYKFAQVVYGARE